MQRQGREQPGHIGLGKHAGGEHHYHHHPALCHLHHQVFILVGLGIVGGVGLIVVEILYHKHKVVIIVIIIITIIIVVLIIILLVRCGGNAEQRQRRTRSTDGKELSR